MMLLRDSLSAQLQRVLAERHAEKRLDTKGYLEHGPFLTTPKFAEQQCLSSPPSVVQCISFSVNPDLIRKRKEKKSLRFSAIITGAS